MDARRADPGSVADTKDREIVTTRIIDAPRELVWKAFADTKALAQWYGPNGFTLTTKVFDFKEGGDWIFMMHGPDGRNYPNIVHFIKILEPVRIVHDHGDDEGKISFLAEITLDAVGNKTRVTLRSVFQSKEALEFVVREHGAAEGAQQTLGRLDELVKQMRDR
ncbi:MAG: SRPBCC family protein [Flavobacteriales bacterium]|nr:SRPBCC family protein [Flavobacteriales bacterium]MBK6943753.1 SRPBCC family protein [Flavobacteriales bacterium]MBK7239965.1 SRPBCC family protein [Flavobacteriales bacterium]MBK7297009.1 SRPBCC family protein [Flavobacteriales bacterium]MBK9535715.1 SRPBCC family protein [Flavobacteriales bacterium]